MKYRLVLILLAIPCLLSARNNFESFIQSIDTNNLDLIAARRLCEAEILEAQTEIYLNNPGISYDHLSGANDSYSEMVISQSFDFPTTYVHKNKLAGIASSQAANRYRDIRFSVLLEASECYAQQIILKRKLGILSELDSLIANLYLHAERKLELGEAGIIEINRIKSEAVRNKVELQLLITENKLFETKLLAYNGGEPLGVDINNERPFIVLPEFSDSLINEMVQAYPSQGYWQNEIQKTDRAVQLQRSQSLPRFEIGYRQDHSSGQVYNGVSAGISIPLFEDKHKVKLAKAHKEYAFAELTSNRLTIKTEIEQIVEEYLVLFTLLKEFEALVDIQHTPHLLLKAFKMGYINYFELFSEYSGYKEFQFYIQDVRLQLLLIELKLYLMLNV